MSSWTSDLTPNSAAAPDAVPFAAMPGRIIIECRSCRVKHGAGERQNVSALMRIEKHELRQRWSELRSLVNEWDPIGLIEAGAPVDEYECVVGPLLRMLEERATVDSIATYLATEFDEHFGVPITDAATFSERASSWYETRWPATTAR